ncbi:mannose-6-phosphate isomerase, class I [Haloechinothrix sp. LS1_15]|uniref:mannose-6-phosphate isomerase, class I n=1 Tax=Haloechinothrix sp. LS1_15 TaxID=2652248 RepID=UPI002944BE5F|nr:mannose-6-phosphate isomerase, class I [Haloechinothrix sp. LS1_15]MDV6011565.1 mannose-6-phosphate isomerase, class I [Haloechinothrix sp. LS1_15]
MDLLRNAVRAYAWGSRSVIPELLGKPTPAAHPEAELWMGAHPGDPSAVESADGSEYSLLDMVEADPANQLGDACVRRWGNRLPFLLKILAAEEPLSMQTHPTMEQAQAGYAREEEAGIARDAGERNYPDPTAKPELVCALTEFHVLAGFRDANRTVKFLRAIETPCLSGYTDLLAGQPNADGLRALFTTWITLPRRTIDTLLPEVLDACATHAEAGGEFASECRTITELGHRHPSDAGVLAALLLNRIVLRAGEAIYLPPGNLHLYLHGTAVEILANSDNVLRCGLTPKHVDVPELLRVVNFTSGPTPVLRGQRADETDRRLVYVTEAAEFELSRLYWPSGDRQAAAVPVAGPRILVCTQGEVRLRVNGETRHDVRLPRGRSVWLPASDPAVTVWPTEDAGASQVFCASPGAL